MTDFDLDRLGDVWRQDPDPGETERLRKSAAAVARRARVTQVIDIAAAVGVAAIVILLVLSNPKTDTLLIGAGAIAVLLGSNIRLRKLRQVELRNLTGSTEDMLDQSIARIEATLRYRRFSIAAIGPAFLIGLLVASMSENRRLASIFPALENWPLLRFLWMGLGVAVVAVGTLFALRAMRRNRAELERLRAMREAYRHEGESSGA
ncbi:MAG TPA: hypothetical protein VMG08_16305 [Allosphingosinicella sp.]|nr:hypothetical protein [Allosphingosinicella sp.]